MVFFLFLHNGRHVCDAFCWACEREGLNSWQLRPGRTDSSDLCIYLQRDSSDLCIYSQRDSSDLFIYLQTQSFRYWRHAANIPSQYATVRPAFKNTNAFRMAMKRMGLYQHKMFNSPGSQTALWLCVWDIQLNLFSSNRTIRMVDRVYKVTLRKTALSLSFLLFFLLDPSLLGRPFSFTSEDDGFSHSPSSPPATTMYLSKREKGLL